MSTQVPSSVLAPRLPAMWGRATLAMEVSSTSMKAARATVMAMSQGLTRGFHGVSGAALGFSTVVTLAPPLSGDRDFVSGKTSPWLLLKGVASYRYCLFAGVSRTGDRAVRADSVLNPWYRSLPQESRENGIPKFRFSCLQLGFMDSNCPTDEDLSVRTPNHCPPTKTC